VSITRDKPTLSGALFPHGNAITFQSGSSTPQVAKISLEENKTGRGSLAISNDGDGDEGFSLFQERPHKRFCLELGASNG